MQQRERHAGIAKLKKTEMHVSLLKLEVFWSVSRYKTQLQTPDTENRPKNNFIYFRTYFNVVEVCFIAPLTKKKMY